MLSRLSSKLLSTASRSFSASASAATPAVSSYPITNLETVLRQYPIAQITEIENGIRVITENTNHGSATIGVVMDTGSRYESDYATNGVAHFVEHMLFKGTNRRTRYKLEVEVENMGGHLNAYTTRETTTYNMKVTKDNIPQAMDILGDMLSNSIFHPRAIENERSTILREARSVEENLQEVVMDQLHLLAYKDQPLGQLILGTDDHIKTLSKSMMHDYVRNNFVGERMLIVGTGDVDHDDLVELTRKNFNTIPKSPVYASTTKGTANFNPTFGTINEPSLGAVHIGYAFETAGWKDVDLYPLFCFQMMLGNYVENNTQAFRSSNTRIRELAQLGITRSMDPFNTIYSDSGLFGLYMVHNSSGEGNPEEMEAIRMANEISVRNFFLTATECTEEELYEAKNRLKMSLFGQLDGSTAAFEDIGRQILGLGARTHPLEVLQQIDSITPKDIMNVCQKYFINKAPIVMAVGDVEGLNPPQWWNKPVFNDIEAQKKIYATASL